MGHQCARYAPAKNKYFCAAVPFQFAEIIGKAGTDKGKGISCTQVHLVNITGSSRLTKCVYACPLAAGGLEYAYFGISNIDGSTCLFTVMVLKVVAEANCP